MKTRMRRYLMMSLGAAVLTLVGCFPRGTGPGGGNPGNARFVHMFNCTHVNGPTSPPSGRAFNIWTRVDGGDWIARIRFRFSRRSREKPHACVVPALGAVGVSGPSPRQ
jgi:hypothetical protein